MSVSPHICLLKSNSKASAPLLAYYSSIKLEKNAPSKLYIDLLRITNILDTEKEPLTNKPSSYFLKSKLLISEIDTESENKNLHFAKVDVISKDNTVLDTIDISVDTLEGFVRFNVIPSAPFTAYIDIKNYGSKALDRQHALEEIVKLLYKATNSEIAISTWDGNSGPNTTTQAVNEYLMDSNFSIIKKGIGKNLEDYLKLIPGNQINDPNELESEALKLEEFNDSYAINVGHSAAAINDYHKIIKEFLFLRDNNGGTITINKPVNCLD